MKIYRATCCLYFLLVPICLTALPQGEKIVSGEMQVSREENTLSIKAADKSILSYETFDIAKGEHVRFIQPSKKATVLNRVTSSNLSNILGNLSSNGKVFLVNPNGVYFGPDSHVDTGSLIVSTLDLLDQDFLDGRYSFHLKGKNPSFIHNEGFLNASDGVIALISPKIKNEGFIKASLEKVVLLSGEAVTLSFDLQGLMSFEILEDAQDSIIEHIGGAQARQVFLQVGAVKKAVEAVINTEGLVAADSLIKENGKVRIAKQSSIKAEDVFIEGADVLAEGTIEVRETLHILGDNLSLCGAHIDASKAHGGGTVLIGGEYKGGEGVRTALSTTIDEHTLIKANALQEGDGGRVIVWADETTVFNGKIEAQGGEIAGNGGFVETSGKQKLSVRGSVNTTAVGGRIGQWLLDPATISIIAGSSGSLPLDCTDTSTTVLGASTIGAALSTVTLCATTSITLTSGASITMATIGAGLIFEGSNSTITTTLNDSITTNGGEITFTSTLVVLGDDVLLDTTNGGTPDIAADISFDSEGTINGAQILQLAAGSTGVISFGAAIGNTAPLTGLTIDSAEGITFAGNVTMTGANALLFPSPVAVLSALTISTGGANTTFSSTVDGPGALTINASTTGNVTFTGAVGGAAPLLSLTVTGKTNTQSSSAQTVGLLSYTGQTSNVIGGNITTDGGNITLVGAVTLSGSPSFDTTNSGDQLLGGNISFSSTVNGATALTLDAGTAGKITFSGTVGNSDPLTNLTFTGAALIRIGANVTMSGANPLIFPDPVRMIGASTINSGGNDITFDGTLNGTFALVLQAGSGTATFPGPIGSTLPFTSFSVTAANIVQDGYIVSTGAVVYTNTGLATITANISAGSFTQTGGGTVSLSGSITALTTISFGGAISLDGSVSLSASGAGGITLSGGLTPSISESYNLTLSALGGVITAAQLGSASFYINVLTLSAKALSVSSIYAKTVIRNGSQTISSNITAPGANLIFANPTTVSSGGPYTIDVSGGTTPGSITFSATLDGPGSLAFVLDDGNLNFNNFVGSITAFGDAAIASAQNVTLAKTFTGSSFTQVAGGGTTTIAGTMTTSSSSGISLTGTILEITGSLITESAGPVEFDNSGLLTILGSINSNGLVAQTGTGTVLLGNTITTTNVAAASATVDFAGPITLIDEVVINTVAGGADITFGSLATIDGLYDLSLVAGTGDISFGAEIGSVTPLGALTVYSAGTLTIGAAEVSSFIQAAGTNTTTLSGSMLTTGDAGIMIVGNIININASIETMGSGPIILENSGMLTIDAAATVHAGGIFVQKGTGDTTISGDVIAH